jgi:ribosomal protein L11 methyltransferase
MISASQNKIWFSAAVETAKEAIDAVEFALLESGALGTEINTLGKDKLAEFITVIGYFNEEIDLQPKLNEALEIYDLPSGAIKSVNWQEVEQRDWLEEWKKGWQPVESAQFVVAPEWSEIADPENKIIIRIEPGMAFGTGTHETTRLCLEAIDKYFTGGSFLDVGTGTAVLAIAAAKMFPESRVEACDTDTDSVTIARENAELNEVGGIKFYEGSITADTADFDFVCANLTADVIILLLPLLVEKSHNFLVLSGILAEQTEMVTSELHKLGQENFGIGQLGEWISITVDRRCKNTETTEIH